MIWIEVALLIMERYFEGKLLSEYWKDEHFWWFGMTVVFLLVPGALCMFASIVHTLTEEDDYKDALMSVMFSLTFPVSIIFL